MARESMSSLDLHVWTRLRQDLVGLRVDNVYVARGAVAIKLRGRAEALVLEPGVRAHLSSRTSALEPASRGVAAAMKAHLRDLKISALEQLGFDRVLRVELGEYSIYAELLPRGFLVLAKGGKVIAANAYASLRDRSVKPGAEYKPPPLQLINPFHASAEEVAKRISSGKDIVRGLVRGLGLGGEAAEEVVHRAGLKPESPPSLSAEELERLVREMRGLYEESLLGKGYLLMKEGRPAEATPFRPTRGQARELASFDEALDELFARREEKDAALEAERRKLEESLRRAQELELSYQERARRLRELAEKLATNYELLERVTACAQGVGPCEGVRRLPDGSIEASLGEVTFRVLRGESAQALLVRLYREAGELESKARRAREAIEEARKGMEELELRAKARELAAKARARRAHWFEKYRWTLTSNGFIAVGGRDASQNDSLVRRLLGDQDVFLHADIQGGSAVVLLSKGEERPEDVEDAAVIAACYSKAWKAGLASVDVYWVRGSQVSKSAPAGEYLKTGAFMVYGQRNYLRGVRLLLAVGIALDEEGSPVVVAGAERVVRRLSLAYTLLTPGDLRIEEAAEKVRERLAEALEEKHIALAVRKEEIADKLPGSSSVFRARRGEGEGLRIR
ncbi:MAG: ribosome rescue protein RqcH [Acidilobaceae archaeon]|nr:ribosome rescue protein RqcH [Acidilobaceae archaeon]